MLIPPLGSCYVIYVITSKNFIILTNFLKLLSTDYPEQPDTDFNGAAINPPLSPLPYA